LHLEAVVAVVADRQRVAEVAMTIQRQAGRVVELAVATHQFPAGAKQAIRGNDEPTVRLRPSGVT
jgi:hypothetical protein